MKRWFTTLMTLAAFAILGVAGASAQTLVKGSGNSAFNGAPNYPLIDGWENIQVDTTLWGQYGFWDPGTDCSNQPPPCWDFYENGRDYLEIYDYADEGYAATYGDPPQGASAIVLDWGLFTDQSWGGSSALQHYLPDSVAFPNRADGDLKGGRFYDFSDFTHINLDYLVLAPGSPATNFRIKTQDASEGQGTQPSSQTEDWYMEDQAMYQDASGTWVTGTYPLESLGNVGPGTGGFSRPGCPGSCWSGIYGNGEFDTDKLVGFQLEWTTGQLGAVDDSSSAGTIVWDNFRVTGERYGVVEGFEGAADGSWKNSNAGSYTITASDDAVEGAQSIQVDFNVVGDKGWGGNVEIQGNAEGGYYPIPASSTHISLFYKVLTPSALPDAILTMKIFDESNGVKEQWNFETKGAPNDASGQWRRLLIPLDQVFHPSWEPAADLEFDQTKVSEIRLELYVAEGSTSTGTILFDRLTPYGFQETDFEAPAAVTGLAASSGVMANVVSWTDVPDETGETYTIYASPVPITGLDDARLEFVATVDEGTEIYTHQLFYPAVDTDLELFYAITCSDKVGNTSVPAMTSTSVTTTAKGIATIAMGLSGSFVADGNMDEWAGIEPIYVGPDGDFGHVGYGIDPTTPADLSANYYIAIDSDYLYYFIDVNDEFYKPAPDDDTSNRWEYDGVEPYIGLYDGRGEIHGGYRYAAEPDYHINLYGNEATSGDINSTWKLTNGDGEYYTGAKTGGWVKELRISLADMQKAGFDKFVPMDGMRLPIDFSLFDDDTPGAGSNRETVYSYSPFNNDNSWSSPANWFYTWLGTKYTAVGVESVSSDVPQSFNLYSNYPNPFNPSTVFRYDLPETGRVTLKVFNILGQEVRTLVDADQAAGTYEVRFDARDLASGVYLYQLQSGNHIQARKMLLVR